MVRSASKPYAWWALPGISYMKIYLYILFFTFYDKKQPLSLSYR